jgi:hypothetical protein
MAAGGPESVLVGSSTVTSMPVTSPFGPVSQYTQRLPKRSGG